MNWIVGTPWRGLRSASALVLVAGFGCGDASPGATTDADSEVVPTGGEAGVSPRSDAAYAADARAAPDGGDTLDDASAGLTDAREGDGSAGRGDANGAACPNGALLCEDFERYDGGGDLATGGWQVTTGAATVTVDGAKPFRGARSAHLRGTQVGAHFTALLVRQGAPLFPIAGNSFYGRMMMWVSQVPTGGVHFNNVQSSGFLPGSTQFAKYGLGGMFASVMGSYTLRDDPNGAPIVDCALGGGGPIPTKQWVCVEWQFDGAGDELHYWFDGKEVNSVVKSAGKCVAAGPPKGVWAAPTFANVQIGWAQYQNGNVPLDMWIDDVALVKDTRVGCP